MIKRISELSTTSSLQDKDVFEVSKYLDEGNETNYFESCQISYANLKENIISKLQQSVNTNINNIKTLQNTIDQVNKAIRFNSTESEATIPNTGVITDPLESLTLKSHKVYIGLSSDAGNDDHVTIFSKLNARAATTIGLKNNTTNILTVNGAATFTGLISGTATSARYSDLAEYYNADQEYKPGTLVQLGGENEITIATDEANAVVTTNPSFIMNTEGKATYQYPVCIALSGRVPVKVDGKVTKFDYIYLGKPGIGFASKHKLLGRNIIGRALKDKLTDDIGLVECIININLG